MWLLLLIYITSLFFIIAFTVKAVRYARMPVHLRWELYPVAHEKGQLTGGSYLQELDWWKKERQKSLLGELKFMAREGLLFEKCYHNNRGLWYFTYPFHMGLFLLVAWLALLFITALMELNGISFTESASTLTIIMSRFTTGVGVTGMVLGIFGCIGLIVKRTVDGQFRLYTSPQDYFNLSFILIILLSGLVAWYFLDPMFSSGRDFVVSLLTFSPTASINPVFALGNTLFALFLVYLPFTHMMHGLAKYFTYHKIVWQDEPSIPGGHIGKKVKELIELPVNWSAPHIQSGNKWKEILCYEKEEE